MYLALLTLPLSTFFCLSLFGRYLGARGAILLSVTSALACACFSFGIFYEVGLCASPCTLTVAPYFNSALMDASWGFLYDTLTAVMAVVVSLISCLVVIYSCSYMIADPHFIRFVSYLKLFTVAMLVLVTADNYVQLFAGWEGVGLASFLLISFWFTRLQASKAAVQAMLLNRVGDVGLALGLICFYFCYKTTNYQALFCANNAVLLNAEPYALLGFSLIEWGTLGLFVGAMGKSGQFGLHAWLPNAMNAPTPVSALLHAATMVNCCHLPMKIGKFNFALCWNSLKRKQFTCHRWQVAQLCHVLKSTGSGTPIRAPKPTIPFRILSKQKCGFQQANQQKTGLSLSSPGFSETVRKITWCCSPKGEQCVGSNTQCKAFGKRAYASTHTGASTDAANFEHNDDFLVWFLGFVEGDGSFYVGSKGLGFEISQGKLSSDVLMQIKRVLGFGHVSTRTTHVVYANGVSVNRHVGVYRVGDNDGFLKLAHLFNGRLIIPYRQVQFARWLRALNAVNANPIALELRPLALGTNVNFSNAWLCGFIDAEGCFTSRLRPCKTSVAKLSLVCAFSITQKTPYVLQWLKANFNTQAHHIGYDPSCCTFGARLRISASP